MKTSILALFLGLLAAGHSAEISCQIKTAKGEVVADAVISLIPLAGEVPAAASEAKAEIEQEGQEFQPYVTVVQTGTRVVFPNHDSVQHHVYSLSKAKKFELPLYNPGQQESLVFDVPGLVTVGCNIHDWMISHLVVVPTPWFAKSDAQGNLKVSAPAGRYRLELWHPRLAAPVTKEVTLADAAATHEDFALTLKPDRRVRRSSGSKGSGY